MKILRIRFKNINSLEGENSVNFEKAPFSDTGVFAITGPNGSGKSSILDAITLGLYGETFRFDRPARHVMTKHAAECFSEIEFSLGQDKYRSIWHVQREDGSPEGDLLPPEMKLVRLNGTDDVLAESPQQVCARITEITGMNFRNFTRSILLAQGDFAAFLNALDSERMAVLETIVGSDIYADYRKEVTDKAAEEQKRLELLEQDLSLIPVMEPAKLEASEQDLADFYEQSEALQSELDELKRLQFSLQKIDDLENWLKGREEELREIQAQAIGVNEKLLRIASSREALQYRGEVTIIHDKKRTVQQRRAELEAFQYELKQLEQLFDSSGMEKKPPEGLQNKTVSGQQQAIGETRYRIGQLEASRYSASSLLQSLAVQISEKKSALETVSAWLEGHAADETLLTNFPETARLKNLRAEIIEFSAKRKAVAQTSKNTISSLKNQQSAIEKETAKLARLKQQMETEESFLAGLVQGKSIEDVEELRQEQLERVQAFVELNKLSLAYRKLTGQGSGFLGFFKSAQSSGPDADRLAGELEQLRQAIRSEENIRLILESAVAQEELLRKMVPDRHLLVDGMPCPLCGALQHPYASNPPAVGSSLQALSDQKAKIKQLRTNAEKLELQLNSAQKLAQINQSNHLQAQLIGSRWLKLANRLNIQTDDLDIVNVKQLQKLHASAEKELKDIVFLSAKYRSKLAAIEKLKTSVAQSSVLIEQLQGGLQKLDSEWRERPDDHAILEAGLAQLQQEEKELAARVDEQLAALGEKMPSKGKEDAFFDRLNSRRQEYHSYVIRRNTLSEELASLAEKEAAVRAEMTAYNEKLEHYGSLLKNEEVIGLHLAVIEKQKLIAGQQQLIAQQEAEAEALHKALLDELRGTPFNGLGELSELFELIEQQPQLEQQKVQLDQDAALLTAELEKTRSDREAEKSALGFDMGLAEANARLRSVAEKLEIAHFEIRHLESLLNEQQQHRQRYDALLALVLEQKEIARECQAEVAQLADGGNMAFRRRVQGRISGKLLSQANSILEKISGRYYLRQQPSEQGLALEIEDTYQGNVRRLPKTLSGGETFIVSLALALALSELANNGKSVDSLFLDEGFGNLDAETLYTVITTLESLRTHGKTVGIISHVESIQKRIKAQLQVIKKPNGMGMLKMAS